ncbi:hypothetical protein [Sorangium sp. So ce117]|uniref:hypothetical protein n=1 Tax=Sorangium sp. So ce117 TaxID=3133277 RepID=UPI003F62C4B7
MIDHLMREVGLTPEQRYCSCSVGVHLRMRAVVDVAKWVVSAYPPKSPFTRRLSRVTGPR